MNENFVTIKVYESSRDTLKTISAIKKENMSVTIERLLNKEFARIGKMKRKNLFIPTEKIKA